MLYSEGVYFSKVGFCSVQKVFFSKGGFLLYSKGGFLPHLNVGLFKGWIFKIFDKRLLNFQMKCCPAPFIVHYTHQNCYL